MKRTGQSTKALFSPLLVISITKGNELFCNVSNILSSKAWLMRYWWITCPFIFKPCGRRRIVRQHEMLFQTIYDIPYFPIWVPALQRTAGLEWAPGKKRGCYDCRCSKNCVSNERWGREILKLKCAGLLIRGNTVNVIIKPMINGFMLVIVHEHEQRETDWLGKQLTQGLIQCKHVERRMNYRTQE